MSPIPWDEDNAVGLMDSSAERLQATGLEPEGIEFEAQVAFVQEPEDNFFAEVGRESWRIVSDDSNASILLGRPDHGSEVWGKVSSWPNRPLRTYCTSSVFAEPTT